MKKKKVDWDERKKKWEFEFQKAGFCPKILEKLSAEKLFQLEDYLNALLEGIKVNSFICYFYR